MNEVWIYVCNDHFTFALYDIFSFYLYVFPSILLSYLSMSLTVSLTVWLFESNYNALFTTVHPAFGFQI